MKMYDNSNNVKSKITKQQNDIQNWVLAAANSGSYIETHTHMHTPTYIYLYMCVCKGHREL